MVHRTGLVLALAFFAFAGDSDPAHAQRRSGFNFGGGGGNNDNNNNNSNNNQGGGRRGREREQGGNFGGIRIGGSDAQKVQDAIDGIQGVQGNSGQFQQRRGGQHGQGPQGQQFNNPQQWQNFQGNNQGNWQNQNWQNQGHRRRGNDFESWAITFGGSRPFSTQWYNDHPHAWHHHHHHDDDAWKVATAVGVLGWLGWGGQPYYPDATVVYQPVPIGPIYVEGQPVVADPNAPGEWMTIGVYSLLSSPSDDDTRLMQLAVDKHGNVRGNYYDTLANTSHNLTGRIHQQSQQVQWSIDSNRQLLFFTPLSQLTQAQGVVYVKYPSGQQQQWQLIRMEEEPN